MKAIRTIHVGNIGVDLMDGDRITARLAQGIAFEPETLRVWADILTREAKRDLACAPRARATLIDAGAYTGLFTIAALKAKVRCIAFEPMPANAIRLWENVSINALFAETSCDARQMALSDHNGQETMYYDARVALTSGGSISPKNTAGRTPVRVHVCSLDSQAHTITGRVAAMKIDVERHEPEVLRGARATIQRWRPSIIAEALDRDAQRAIDEQLSEYELVAILDKTNLYYEPRQGSVQP